MRRDLPVGWEGLEKYNDPVPEIKNVLRLYAPTISMGAAVSR